MLSAELMTLLLQLDRDEVNEVYDVLKHHIHSLNRHSKNALSVGDKVWFTDKGKRIDCYVEKINRTKVIVRPLDGGRGWRVGASILSPIESPIISNEDMTKLNGAIEEAAKQIVANKDAWKGDKSQQVQKFNPATGDFE